MVVEVLHELLRDPWFDGTYVGVDIDNEMIEYRRYNFPAERFKFMPFAAEECDLSTT